MAAFISLSRTTPQLQVHSRTERVSSLLIEPQTEQVFELGSKRPICMMFLPDHSDLYVNMVTNVDQPQSLIDCASLWFLTMLLTAKCSIQILSWLLISVLEDLCKKSLRWLATFSWSNAKRFLFFFPLYFETLRCTYFKRAICFFRNLGLSKCVPFEATTKVLIPKSIPIAVSIVIGFLLGIACLVSQSIEAKYLPVGVLLIVACLISPFISRCRTISIPLVNLGIDNLPSLIATFCGTLKDWVDVFFLNLGKSARPLKKLVKAVSMFVIACCNACELTSLSQSHSDFKPDNCLCKSKQERFTCLEAYARVLVSRDRLYTNLHEPICLLSKTACSVVGYKRYLNAFNIEEQRCNILFKQNVNYV